MSLFSAISADAHNEELQRYLDKLIKEYEHDLKITQLLKRIKNEVYFTE
jgi:CRISPR/Cas system CSM-associated protein Csm4 (group 5 of RAMP superfamily)